MGVDLRKIRKEKKITIQPSLTFEFFFVSFLSVVFSKIIPVSSFSQKHYHYYYLVVTVKNQIEKKSIFRFVLLIENYIDYDDGLKLSYLKARTINSIWRG